VLLHQSGAPDPPSHSLATNGQPSLFPASTVTCYSPPACLQESGRTTSATGRARASLQTATSTRVRCRCRRHCQHTAALVAAAEELLPTCNLNTRFADGMLHYHAIVPRRLLAARQAARLRHLQVQGRAQVSGWAGSVCWLQAAAALQPQLLGHLPPTTSTSGRLQTSSALRLLVALIYSAHGYLLHAAPLQASGRTTAGCSRQQTPSSAAWRGPASPRQRPGTQQSLPLRWDAIVLLCSDAEVELGGGGGGGPRDASWQACAPTCAAPSR
jgi:hypothetical protein